MHAVKKNSIEQNEVIATKIIDLLSQNNCTMADTQQCLEFVSDILLYQKVAPSSQILNYQE